MKEVYETDEKILERQAGIRRQVGRRGDGERNGWEVEGPGRSCRKEDGGRQVVDSVSVGSRSVAD